MNVGARETLVPNVIIPLMAMTQDQETAFVRYTFENFDFQGEYIPIDLERRGFPLDKLDDVKYHNYAYARNMKLIWRKLRIMFLELSQTGGKRTA